MEHFIQFDFQECVIVESNFLMMMIIISPMYQPHIYLILIIKATHAMLC